MSRPRRTRSASGLPRRAPAPARETSRPCEARTTMGFPRRGGDVNIDYGRALLRILRKQACDPWSHYDFAEVG